MACMIETTSSLRTLPSNVARRVQLIVPVRDAPWRSQLRRLQGAGFVKQFWDATAMKTTAVA
eukprot:CAMPEP_0117457912 /NCGR_PEP_ID=MMETSP0784-20121206/657_1 /TAXON_ID=39447 /ORGANISM="" /LENGTH=61 /DNA_ID=CAMNT_0005251409 /DNA_START=287 /DNA_END=468 /DNA_ORIENTATION=+